MSLAAVIVSPEDFDEIHAHLLGHMPKHRNMHLRQARYRNKRRVLHYLHALYAPGTSNAPPMIEGVISGPDVFWQYRLERRQRTVQRDVIDEVGSQSELDRIEVQFLPEIMRRVRQERERAKHHPRLLAGQLYLRRSLPGMPAHHRNCAGAVAAGTLDQTFVDVLAPWNFALLSP